MKTTDTLSAIAPATEANAESARWSGIWHDGLCTHPHPVRVEVARKELRLFPEANALAEPRHYSLAGLACPESWHGAPRCLVLPDGSSLWVQDDPAAGFLAALQAAGLPQAWVSRLIASWAWGLLATLMTIALVIWLDRSGIPGAAEVMATNLPRRIENRIWQPVFKHLDGALLAPSKLSDERKESLRQRFAEAAMAIAPKLEFRVEFRSDPRGDVVNAFALPGHIVVLDGLADRLSNDEILGVLGHELGHLAHRHSMEGLVRTSGLVLLGAAVLGDVSMLGTGALVLARSQQHSREAEREADAYALRVVDAAGVARGALVSMMQKFEDLEKEISLPPEWTQSHPATANRRQYFEEQAAQQLAR